MAKPTITIEVALATNPAATPTWVNISAYWKGLEIHRGRVNELQTVEAGTAVLTLDNADRRFDPTNASGPYYGNLLPMRRVRVRAAWNGVAYDLFAGYVDGWPQTWPLMGYQSQVQLRCTDGFKVLSLKKIGASYSQERSDVRIANVLDDAGWQVGSTPWQLDYGQLGVDTILGPEGGRLLDAGYTTVQASTLASIEALTHLRAVEQSEGGVIFITAGGDFAFHNRYRRALAPYSASQATFGDQAGELRYLDLALDYDDTWIWNEAAVTREGGAEQTASDATSIAQYFGRTLVRATLHTSDSEALNQAQFLVGAYKDPAVRAATLAFQPERDDAGLWPQALGRELGDKITVRRRPPGGGAVIEQDCHIEQIEHFATPEAPWQTRWQLSPAALWPVWVLDDAANSVLGSTTRLGY